MPIETLTGTDQRLRLALEVSGMGTWDYDVPRDTFEWSPELARTLGADLASVEDAVRAALGHGRDVELERRVELEHGRLRWILLKGQLAFDRVIGVGMDITDGKEAHAARLALEQSARLRSLGQMASGIAHDLNQSLALISGYSDMARQELHLDHPDLARIREMVDITARAALEGGQALKGLLSFARTQELLAETERVDLAQILSDAARLTAPRWRDAAQAEGRPIELSVEAQPDLAIDGSPAALREALTNLIFNAIDALPRGGAIRLTARSQPDGVSVEVQDTGTGIPPDVRSRLFEPFFTTKGERGTGLGLAQVLAIVERHGGTIDVRSVLHQGTTFCITFPPAGLTPLRREAPRKLPTAPAPRRPIRILVVEDEEQLAKMASLVLSQRGHRVTVVHTGEDAAKQLEQSQFDLVISDLGLGAGMNGWDLAHLVRERWSNTNFVLVTGWGAAIDPGEARDRGVDEVLGKPYRIAELRQVADNVASGKRKR